MARKEVSGLEIEYELIGDGLHTVVVMPGGRMSKDAPGMREFAEALVAGGKRVLLWDRPNCGASDMCFSGESESAMQAEVLVELVRQLDLGRVAVGGGSAGARTAMLAAAHDPATISHLLLWWISGGVLSQLSLGANYCSEPAVAASMGGMEAVANLPSLAEQMARNSRNREILRRQDVSQFIAVMERWADAFVPGPDRLLPGMSREAVGRLSMPTMIVRSSERDLYHPAWVSELMHRLVPHSRLVDPPWTEEEYIARMSSGNGHFLDWHRLASPILSFLA